MLRVQDPHLRYAMLTGSDDMLIRLEDGLRRAGYGPGGGIVVALSGGPDSTALTVGLTELLGGRDQIVAAHFNHRTRGQESEADEEFVRDLCDEIGTPLHVGHASEASDGMSENDARNLRYRFLQDIADELGVPYVAVAHTADDQAETVLLRIARGTGMRGLAAMPYTRPIADGSGVSLIRPMLDVTRAEVAQFLNERGIVPRHDASNDDVRYARNRIRHHVMPALAEINPAVVQALTRLAKIAREHNEFVEAEFGVAVQLFDWPNLHGIQDLARPLAARVLEAAHADVAESGAQLEMQHIESALQLVNRAKDAELHLPGNVILRHSIGETTILHRDSVATAEPLKLKEAKLPIPGSVVLSNGMRMTAEIVKVPDSFEEAPRSGHQCAYISRRVSSYGRKEYDYLIVRGRKPGDRYHRLETLVWGYGGEKVQDLMVNAKIPRSQRYRVPFVVDPEHSWLILWIVGFPPSTYSKVRRWDRECIKLTVHAAANS